MKADSCTYDLHYSMFILLYHGTKINTSVFNKRVNVFYRGKLCISECIKFFHGSDE